MLPWLYVHRSFKKFLDSVAYIVQSHANCRFAIRGTTHATRNPYLSVGKHDNQSPSVPFHVKLAPGKNKAKQVCNILVDVVNVKELVLGH